MARRQMVVDICRRPHYVGPNWLECWAQSGEPGYGAVGRRHEREGCSEGSMVNESTENPETSKASGSAKHDPWGQARSPWPMLACLCASLVLKYVLGSSEESGRLNTMNPLNTWDMYGHVWCSSTMKYTLFSWTIIVILTSTMYTLHTDIDFLLYFVLVLLSLLSPLSCTWVNYGSRKAWCSCYQPQTILFCIRSTHTHTIRHFQRHILKAQVAPRRSRTHKLCSNLG